MLSERQVNYATFIRVHRLKGKRDAAVSYLLCREVCHCLEFGFARGSKTLYVADNSFSRRQMPTKNLIE